MTTRKGFLSFDLFEVRSTHFSAIAGTPLGNLSFCYFEHKKNVSLFLARCKARSIHFGESSVLLAKISVIYNFVHNNRISIPCPCLVLLVTLLGNLTFNYGDLINLLSFPQEKGLCCLHVVRFGRYTFGEFSCSFAKLSNLTI